MDLSLPRRRCGVLGRSDAETVLVDGELATSELPSRPFARLGGRRRPVEGGAPVWLLLCEGAGGVEESLGAGNGEEEKAA